MTLQPTLLTNPLTGDTFEFLERSADTGGERVTIRMTLHSRGEVVPPHYHVIQSEHFTVESGRLTILLNGEMKVLEPGMQMTLPENVPHNHYNAEAEPLVFTQTVTPALDFEYLIENLVGLAADGKLKNGKAGIIQELVTLRYLDSKTFLAGIPRAVQTILMYIVGPIARLFGYRAIYTQYSGFEK